MNDFFCKLIPPRPSFAHDMSAEEQRLMQEHAGYWQKGLELGQALAFGFVGDPAGAFGVGILRVDDVAAARAFTDSDPVIRSNRGFAYTIMPMPMGMTVR